MTFLERLEAEDQIRQALGRYFRGADRMDYEMFASAYHDDAEDEHGEQNGDISAVIAKVKVRHAKIEQNLHLPAPSTIEFASKEKAFVETPCLLMQHARIGDEINFSTRKPLYRRFTFACRYIDRFEKRSNEWKIARRVVAFEWTQEELVDLALGSDWNVAKRSREDMVYRIRDL